MKKYNLKENIRMKRFIALSVLLAFPFIFSACSQATQNGGTENSVPESNIIASHAEPAPTDEPVSVVAEVRNFVHEVSLTPDATVIILPEFRAVSSGYQTGWSGLEEFIGNVRPLTLSLNNIIFESPDFLMFQDGRFNWIWAVDESVTESDVAPYEIIDFAGGLYATATSIDDDFDSMMAVINRIESWLETTGFAVDNSRGHQRMTGMIYICDEVEEGLGYEQLQIYIPIKLR
jgi:hypothetical protein